jgi:hypothetical protein
MTVKVGEKYKLKYLYRMQAKDFDLIPESSNENLQVVNIQDRDSDSYYVVLDGKTIYFY